MAKLEVARASALQAKTLQGADADASRVRALAAYKEFLTLWKDADPDPDVKHYAQWIPERQEQLEADVRLVQQKFA